MTTTTLETTLEGECAETGTPVYVDVRLHFDVEPASGDGWNEPRTRGGCTFTHAERLDTTPPQGITGGYLKRLADEFGPKHEEEAWCEWREAQRADADEALEQAHENRRERLMED